MEIRDYVKQYLPELALADDVPGQGREAGVEPEAEVADTSAELGAADVEALNFQQQLEAQRKAKVLCP